MFWFGFMSGGIFTISVGIVIGLVAMMGRTRKQPPCIS